MTGWAWDLIRTSNSAQLLWFQEEGGHAGMTGWGWALSSSDITPTQPAKGILNVKLCGHDGQWSKFRQ
jgi:hypothetical protein